MVPRRCCEPSAGSCRNRSCESGRSASAALGSLAQAAHPGRTQPGRLGGSTLPCPCTGSPPRGSCRRSPSDTRPRSLGRSGLAHLGSVHCPDARLRAPRSTHGCPVVEAIAAKRGHHVIDCHGRRLKDGIEAVWRDLQSAVDPELDARVLGRLANVACHREGRLSRAKEVPKGARPKLPSPELVEHQEVERPVSRVGREHIDSGREHRKDVVLAH